MTPAPSNLCFRHKPEEAACYGAVRPKPIPADPNGKAVVAERSLAGNTNGKPICGRVETSLLPLKKRATSDTSSDHSGADCSSVIPPKKKRRSDSRSDGTSRAYGVPVQAYDYDTVTVCATAASPKPSSSKAIIVVTSQRQPPLKQKKLMHDGIRSGGATPWRGLAARDGYMEQAESSAAGAARAKKNTNRNKNNGRRRQAPEAVPSPPRELRLTAELRHHLAEELRATTQPHFVCMKTLHKSDVDRNQNRLLFSCKGECFDSHPITALYAGIEKETFYVTEYEHGLRVSAFDGHAREFTIKLRYLDSNGGYRLITGWSAFVAMNKLAAPVINGRHVEVEVWAFRSRRLPWQPPLTDKDMQEFVDGLEGHPNGDLGLLFIPYVDGKDREEWAEEEMAEEEWEPAPPVHQTKRQASAKAVREEKRIAEHLLREEKRIAQHALREEKRIVHHLVPEEKRIAHHVARKEKRTADHVRANRGKAVAREMTIEEVIREVGPEEADSLLGLLMLASPSRCCPVPMLTLDVTHRSSGTTM